MRGRIGDLNVKGTFLHMLFYRLCSEPYRCSGHVGLADASENLYQ